MAGTKRFPDETWKEIVSIIASCFVMDGARAARILNNPTAKLIAAIPFLAGCREPERSSLAHLATFVLSGSEAGEKVFDHKAEDNYDVLARLATIAHFEGGDPAIINKGMKLLATMMIEGYARDLASDKAKGLYNPINDGKWNAEEKLSSLASAAAAVEDAEMDEIVGSAKHDWWMRG
jgi:hypothetical protein